MRAPPAVTERRDHQATEISLRHRKAFATLRNELACNPLTQSPRSEAAQIDVEVRIGRLQSADVHALRLDAFAQPGLGSPALGIVVAGDVEAPEPEGQLQGGEVVGREPREHRHLGKDAPEGQHGLEAFADREDVINEPEAHAGPELVPRDRRGSSIGALRAP